MIRIYCKCISNDSRVGMHKGNCNGRHCYWSEMNAWRALSIHEKKCIYYKYNFTGLMESTECLEAFSANALMSTAAP